MVKYLLVILSISLVACQEKIDPVDEISFKPGNRVIRLNPVDVSKQNKLPLYVHYMPWFEAPNDTTANWGYHWRMVNADPNNIDANGRREIASHFYPLIGPYHSADPDVIRYHLLLMKYSGVDGILIDWYGIEGSNGDIEMLLNNTNAIIPHLDEVGLKFAVVLEDRFAENTQNVVANLQYLEDKYYPNARYITSEGDPLVLVFGPIGVGDPAEWANIAASTFTQEKLLPLWFNGSMGNNAAGQYAWPVEGGVSAVESWYSGVKVDDLIGGVAFPGFKDYYLEGTGNDIIGWEIPVSSTTMQAALDASLRNLTAIDFLQVATWNDFGEGTIIEPTVENEFTFLKQLQQFTFLSRFGEAELELIHEWYMVTKDESIDDNEDAQIFLEQAFYHLVALDVDAARSSLGRVYEN